MNLCPHGACAVGMERAGLLAHLILDPKLETSRDSESLLDSAGRIGTFELQGIGRVEAGHLHQL